MAKKSSKNKKTEKSDLPRDEIAPEPEGGVAPEAGGDGAVPSDAGGGGAAKSAGDVIAARSAGETVADISAMSDEDAAFFRKLRWVKILIWGFFLGLVYVLSSFFAIIFLTFIISYMARNVVTAITDLIGDRRGVRKATVVFTFVVFIFLVYSCGRFIVPNILQQARSVYAKVAGMDLHREGNVEGVICKALGAARFLFFQATDEYKTEFDEFKALRLAELDESGWQIFQDEAAQIRREFRARQADTIGEEIIWEREGTREYLQAFDSELRAMVEKDIYLPRREELEQDKMLELMMEHGGIGFEKLKASVEDWPTYLKNLVVSSLSDEVERSPEDMLRYKEFFRQREKIREGEAALDRIVQDDPAEWESKFKDFYNALPMTKKDFNYDKFVALEKTGGQEEYEQQLGGVDLGEEKLADRFRRKKEREFGEEFKQYAFISNFSDASVSDLLPDVASLLVGAIGYLFTFGFALVLSVFFSFIIVWDIPKLTRTVKRLDNSRVSDFYREVVPGLRSFGSLMGRAFQAQAIIAVMNTLLTLAALTIFDVENRAFLCTIVFICSFIPVVGVIMSSVPIALIALNQPDGGFALALKMVAAIVVIHFIETTVLNPKVMGDMLKLHPLLVLIILVVGEHFFGVWGLLLGVPLCVYVFRYVILRKDAPAGPPGGAPAGPPATIG